MKKLLSLMLTCLLLAACASCSGNEPSNPNGSGESSNESTEKVTLRFMDVTPNPNVKRHFKNLFPPLTKKILLLRLYTNPFHGTKPIIN